MDLDKEAKKLGLNEPSKELVFETDGSVWNVRATCPDCGFEEEKDVTVFAADYTYEMVQDDLMDAHHVFSCPSPKWRWYRFKQDVIDGSLRLIRRQRTPWGIKHIDWRPNWKKPDGLS